jgi:NADH dehydrogenase
LLIVLVGDGPADVEMAGAITVLVRNGLRTQFRRIDATSAHIVLVDMSNKDLGPFGGTGVRVLLTIMERRSK